MPKGKSNKKLIPLLDVLELAAEKGDFSKVDGRSLRPAMSSRSKLKEPPFIKSLHAKRGDAPGTERYALTPEGRTELKKLRKASSPAPEKARTTPAKTSTKGPKPAAKAA